MQSNSNTKKIYSTLKISGQCASVRGSTKIVFGSNHIPETKASISITKTTQNQTKKDKLSIQILNPSPCPRVNCSSTQHSAPKPILLPEYTFALQPNYKISIPNSEPAKFSNKKYGIVNCYAANTNQGLVRNYNEDRMSIILNIVKPQSKVNEDWPKCSFFGVYDGHGGYACADFLRDKLHQFVIKDPSFPWNPKESLRNGILNAEKKFMELCQSKENIIERSGSCAVVCLVIGDMCYVANVGDSRAVLSTHSGQNIIALSTDHKPMDTQEEKRIKEAGGKIYQASVQKPSADLKKMEETFVGPYRVLPGRLSVSRTFGDPEAKLAKYGGNINVIKCDPDIRSFKVLRDTTLFY